MQHGVHGHPGLEIFKLGFRKAEADPQKQQIADLKEVALLGQLVDGITAIEQFPLIAIDVGDVAVASGRST